MSEVAAFKKSCADHARQLTELSQQYGITLSSLVEEAVELLLWAVQESKTAAGFARSKPSKFGIMS